MEVKYGDHVRLWTTSWYLSGRKGQKVENVSPTSSRCAPSDCSASPSPSPQPSPVRSARNESATTQHDVLENYTGGYIGYYEKNGRHGILSSIPPLGEGLDHLFCQETYEILDPYGRREPGKDIVHYGEPVVLVNQYGMVWNNKTGGITGYIGPRPRHLPGELYLRFERPFESAKEKNPIRYGDDHITIHIVSSNRHTTHFDKVLTNFKKSTSSTLGGYICSDGNGYTMEVSMHPIEPSISKISGKLAKYQDTQVNWGDVIPVSIPPNFKSSDVLEIDLTNQGKIILTADDIREKEYDTTPFLIPLQSAPGSVVMQVSPVDSETPRPLHQQRATTMAFITPLETSIAVVSVAIILSVLVDRGLVVQKTAMWIAIVCWSPLVALMVHTLLASHIKDDETKALNGSATMSSSYTIKLHKWVFGGSVQVEEEEPPVMEYPKRFLDAEKGNHAAALKRWRETKEWREKMEMDTILSKPHPHFKTIKKYYPHYCHFKGKNGEPVWFEKSAKTDLKALRKEGITLDILLRHYALITEFLWTRLEPSEETKSITVIDIQGIGLRDFVGETVDFVRKASEFVGRHYPERAAYIYVLNVPSWFNVIWNVVKPMIDEVTRKKVYILRGKKAIEVALQETIPIENIPKEYGGTGPALGESPQEKLLADLIASNNGEVPKIKLEPHSILPPRVDPE